MKGIVWRLSISPFVSESFPSSLVRDLVPWDFVAGQSRSQVRPEGNQAKQKHNEGIHVKRHEDKRNQIRLGETIWHQVKPHDINLIKMKPSENQCKWVKLTVASWNRMQPNETEWIQVKSSQTKWSYVKPSKPKWDHLIPNGIKRLNWQPVQSSQTNRNFL